MNKQWKRVLSLLLCLPIIGMPFYTLIPGTAAAAASSAALSFPAAQDAFVSNFSGQGDRLGIELNANKLIYGKSRHVYLKFDLSAIDTERYDLNEMSMLLSFRKSHAPNELVFTESESTLRDSYEAWTVNNLTYNNRPNDIAGSPSASYKVTSNGEENLSIDLSEIFRSALSSGRKVISVHLTTASVDDSTISASEMYASRNTAAHPGPTLNVTLGEPIVDDGVDRSALNARISEVEQLIESEYTTDSWTKLVAALAYAKEVSMRNTTQEEINEALALLQAAVNSLEKAEFPIKISAPNMGNYVNNSSTAAMIMKMKNEEGQYVKVDPVTEKLSLTKNAAEASHFALYVLDYFATVNHEEPEVGATKTAYSIKSLDNGKYLTIQNYFTADQFLSNTHRYFNIVSGAPSGTSTDRTFEIKASASMPSWNERFYIDHFASSGYYRIYSHLSTMRDDIGFSVFNVQMSEEAMLSTGTAGQDREYRFYFEELEGNDLLEVKQEISGGQAKLFWQPVNGDTNAEHYRIVGASADIVFADGLMNVTLSDLNAGHYQYVVQYNGSVYQASADVKVRIFNHPGILHTEQDLDRMKQRVQEKAEPWYSDYQRLLNSVSYNLSSADFETTVFSNVGRGGAPADSGNIGHFEKGGNAAYFNALQWVITGDNQFAEKAADILVKWSDSLKVIDGRDRILGAGINAYKYANAAEIIRYYNGGYSGYSDEDFKALQDMMLNVVYPVIQDAAVPMLANGNWDAAAIVSMISIGVLCDNTEIFDRAMALYQDIHVNGSIFAYVHESGQTMETGRDQAHALLAIGYMAEICLIAYNHGEDLYSLYDNRLAKAFEYSAKYNLYSSELYGEEVPFVSMPNVFGDTSRGYYGDGFDRENNGLNRGELRPVFEQGLALYSKAGVEVPWTEKAAAAARPQAMVHFDNLNFATLTFYQGEPVNQDGPYFQMRTRWEPLYQRNWSIVDGQRVAETLNSYYDVNEDGELVTSVMKNEAPFYQLIANDDGTYSIKLVKSNTYLSVKDETAGDYNVIKADATEIGESEKFLLRSSGVGPFFLVSPAYDNRIVYQEAIGSGSSAVLTLRLGTKTLSEVADVPNITTNERLIFMYNTKDIARSSSMPPPITSANSSKQTVTLNGQTATVTKAEDGTYRLVSTVEQISKALSASGSELNITAKDIYALTVELPIAAMGIADLKIETEFGTVIIPNAALHQIKKLYGDTLMLSLRQGSFIVELLHNGKPAAYHDPDNPLIITLPVENAEGRDPYQYVAIKKENGKAVSYPMAISENGSITFAAASTGTYDVLYNGKAFADVIPEYWAARDIAFVTARGLFEGTAANQFSPGATMTRAMLAHVLANLEGIDREAYAESPFRDVPAGLWYTASTAWAFKNGIVSGTGQDSFSPHHNITREQMAVMLYNYAKFKGYKLPSASTVQFADHDHISAWAKEAVDAIAAAGIISGKPDGSFDPKANATRAEVAAVFARFIRAINANSLRT